ncbi:lipocalin family protein [Spirosoma pulveris]
MKNIIPSRLLTYAVVLALPMWFGSCSKNDTPDTVSSTVEGSYKISALTASPKVAGVYEDLLAAAPLLLTTTCLNDITLTFKSGGAIANDNPVTCQKSAIPPSTITGIDATSTWKYDANVLTLTKSDGTKTAYTVLSTGSILKLQWKDSQDFLGTGTKTAYTYTMDLKKQ